MVGRSIICGAKFCGSFIYEACIDLLNGNILQILITIIKGNIRLLDSLCVQNNLYTFYLSDYTVQGFCIF